MDAVTETEGRVVIQVPAVEFGLLCRAFDLPCTDPERFWRVEAAAEDLVRAVRGEVL